MVTLLERTLRRAGFVKFRPASVIHRFESGLLSAPVEVAPEITEASKYAGVYAGSPWVYVAVNRIAEAAALVPFHVYSRSVGAYGNTPNMRQDKA